MINIRNNVFETNSSSSHSIVMTKQDTYLDTVEPSPWAFDEDGSYRIWNEEDLEFGRYPFDVLCDWEGRCYYAIASYGDAEHLEQIEEICRKHVKDFTYFKMPNRHAWDDDEEDAESYGYVDHQSMGLLQAFLKKHNVTLEDFIFNDKYVVIIDGDEYNTFGKLFDSKLINKANVEIIERAFN